MYQRQAKPLAEPPGGSASHYRKIPRNCISLVDNSRMDRTIQVKVRGASANDAFIDSWYPACGLAESEFAPRETDYAVPALVLPPSRIRISPSKIFVPTKPGAKRGSESESPASRLMVALLLAALVILWLYAKS